MAFVFNWGFVAQLNTATHPGT